MLYGASEICGLDIAKLNSPRHELTTYGGIMLTELMRLVYISRGDLGSRFSLSSKFERTVYLLWFLLNARSFFNLPRVFLIQPSWNLLSRPSPEFGKFAKAPLSNLQAALWCAYPMAKVLDLQSADDRLRIELAVSIWPDKLEGMPLLKMSAEARTFADFKEPSLVQGVDEAVITVLMHTVWQVREDLRQAFPLDTKENRLALVNWFAVHANKELDLSSLALSSMDDPAKPQEITSSAASQNLISESAISNPITTGDYSRFGLNVIGSIHGGSGIAKLGQVTAVAAAVAQIPVCMVDHGIVSCDPVLTRTPVEIIATQPKYFASVSAYNPDAFPNFVGKVESVAISQCYNIYYSAWEYPDYPLSYSEIINNFDEVWAPSKFTLESWKASLKRPTYYMPLAVEVSPWHARGRKYFGLPRDAFLFLFAFDYWSWIDRKNPIACLEAFRQAFPRGHERVGLVVKTKNLHGHSALDSDQWKYLKECAQKDPRIKLIEIDLDDCAMHDLMRACDAYVSLHRAEGFGFSIAEAMLVGKPAIATNYSGNTDFTLAGNSCPVNYQAVPISQDCVQKLGINSVWAEVDVAHAAWYMKKLVGDDAYARDIGKAGQHFIETNYNYQVVGEQICDRLSKIHKTRISGNGAVAPLSSPTALAAPPVPKIISYWESLSGKEKLTSSINKLSACDIGRFIGAISGGARDFERLVHTYSTKTFSTDLSRLTSQPFCENFYGMNSQFLRVTLLLKLLRELEIDAFIEIGTNLGETCALIAAQTNLPVFSCRADISLYAKMQHQLRSFGKQVNLFNADSRFFLNNLLADPAVKRPFIYLDEEQLSTDLILEQLQIILTARPELIVLIDDFRVPGENRFRFIADNNKCLEWNYIKDTVTNLRSDICLFHPAYPPSIETGSPSGWVLLVPLLLVPEVKAVIPEELIFEVPIHFLDTMTSR
jgi:glycosyltransferase involved in cell wall biosynthesis